MNLNLASSKGARFLNGLFNSISLQPFFIKLLGLTRTDPPAIMHDVGKLIKPNKVGIFSGSANLYFFLDLKLIILMTLELGIQIMQF